MLRIDHLHERAGLGIPLPTSPEMPGPRLELRGTGTIEEFRSSVAALFGGPASPKKFLGDPYFRDCWIEQKFPKFAFATAIVLQVLLSVFPPPLWKIQPARPAAAISHEEITWYGPAKDFPAMLPAIHSPRPPVRRQAVKDPARGADAFHSRQTILSEPLHPTHPRQTLIRPKAPQEPPKILPALPNIVQLAGAQPERPKLQLTAKELTSPRPNARAALSASNAAAPEISLSEKQPGAINIASSARAPAKPVLPVNPMSAPRSASQNREMNAAAPEIAGRTGETETIIALSATPGPAAPLPAIPAGNLSARVAISPDGNKPGSPLESAAGIGAGAGSASNGGGRGPEGIFISGGNSTNSSPSSGLGGGASRQGANTFSVRPVPHAVVPRERPKSLRSDAEGAANDPPKLGMSPQQVLGAKRVYTLHVNMPNLTSASGSWVLNFAELNEEDSGGVARAGLAETAADLAGLVPLRKVDPKYPPELRTGHVDGEVILYAIIRKDGSVDSIQLVHSVDPILDANAMEALAQWKFHPAERRGEPVDLEAVVHIPFRSRGQAF
ncbi:MAG TPA: TonB family protein [Candidatus Acidoferrales bacterium]|nr:TonB family protein [Candidatus Acidoferrales bacterium]